MRMVLDFSDLDKSTWVNLTGASGHAFSSHYVDQLDAWQSGETFPFPFSKSAVESETQDNLTLTPRRSLVAIAARTVWRGGLASGELWPADVESADRAR